MARKPTTRPKVGTLYINLNTFWRREIGRPEYRGTLKMGDQVLDVSLWIEETVPNGSTPLTLSGEVSEQPKETN